MKLNKMGNYGVGLFGFFFIFTILIALYIFFSYVMHYILYDFALTPTTDLVASQILQVNGTAMNNINTLKSDFLGLNDYFDILFLLLVVSAFIQSTIAAVKTKEAGVFSFFGLITIGNVFLIFIMFYGVQIQGWILNEIVYDVLLVSINSPIIDFFINYGLYLGVLWYLWLLGVNQIDINNLKNKVDSLFNKGDTQNDLLNNQGRFEE